MLPLKALLICSIITTIPVLADPDDVTATSDGKTKGKIDPSLRDLQACKFVHSSTICSFRSHIVHQLLVVHVLPGLQIEASLLLKGASRLKQLTKS